MSNDRKIPVSRRKINKLIKKWERKAMRNIRGVCKPNLIPIGLLYLYKIREKLKDVE